MGARRTLELGTDHLFLVREDIRGSSIRELGGGFGMGEWMLGNLGGASRL